MPYFLNPAVLFSESFFLVLPEISESESFYDKRNFSLPKCYFFTVSKSLKQYWLLFKFNISDNRLSVFLQIYTILD